MRRLTSATRPLQRGGRRLKRELLSLQRRWGDRRDTPGEAQHTSAEPRCNICGSVEFEDFGGRPLALCTSCQSLERHRVCYAVYQQEGLLAGPSTPARRVIQFAPERVTHDMLSGAEGVQYMCADIAPQRYPHAEPLHIHLLDGLDIFPDRYFDFVIHNHVWEHLPGTWTDHIEPFRRILKRNGKMIFTFPFSPAWSPDETIEGGELLESDEDRLRVFGQHDHVRKFGTDFIPIMAAVKHAKFRLDSISDADKQLIRGDVRGVGETVFVLERTD